MVEIYLPTKAATFVYIIKEATLPRIPPTSRDPSASGMGLLMKEEIPIQVAATLTPTTAAKSSKSTTLTLGSCPLNTKKKQSQMHLLFPF